jgi:hypothetical protein
MNISKEILKQSVKTAIEAFRELKQEGIVLNFGSEELVKIVISLYIEGTKQGRFVRQNEAGPMKLTFGKHKNKSLEDLVKSDRGYVQWLADKSTNVAIKKEAARLLEANPVPKVNPKVA